MEGDPENCSQPATSKIFKGATFDSYADFLEVLKQLGKETHTIFNTENSKTVGNANNSMVSTDPNDFYPEKFVYSTIHKVCKHWGNPAKKGQGARRVQTSYKIDCPVEIKLVGNKSLGKLVVTTAVHEHSHETSQAILDQYPENRRLDNEDASTAKTMMALDIAPYEVSKFFKTLTDKKITARDIRNLKDRHLPDDALAHVLNDILENDNQAAIEMVLTPEDTVHTLYIQTSEMKENFRRFSKFMVMDTTYKINVKNMHVCTLMVIDGSGRGRVAAHCIMSRETTETYEYFLGKFVDENPGVAYLEGVLVDKDFKELAAINTTLPGVSVHLCVWHVMCAVRRKLRPLIKVDEYLDAVMQKVREVIYSRTEESFNEKLLTLYSRTTDVEGFRTYFHSCWVQEKSEWALFQRKNVPNYGHTTTNTLESFHQKLKRKLSSQSSLPKCIDELRRYSQRRREEDKNDYIRSKVTTTYNLRDNSPTSNLVFNNVAQPVALVMMQQHDLCQKEARQMELQEDEEGTRVCVGDRSYHLTLRDDRFTCSCTFFTQQEKMCKHGFFFLKEKSMDLPLDWIRPRWRRVPWVEQEPEQDEREKDKKTKKRSSIRSEVRSRKVPYTPQAKYHQALALMKEVASIVSAGDPHLYADKLDVIENLRSAWDLNKRVRLVISDDEEHPQADRESTKVNVEESDNESHHSDAESDEIEQDGRTESDVGSESSSHASSEERKSDAESDNSRSESDDSDKESVSDMDAPIESDVVSESKSDSSSEEMKAGDESDDSQPQSEERDQESVSHRDFLTESAVGSPSKSPASSEDTISDPESETPKNSRKKTRESQMPKMKDLGSGSEADSEEGSDSQDLYHSPENKASTQDSHDTSGSVNSEVSFPNLSQTKGEQEKVDTDTDSSVHQRMKKIMNYQKHRLCSQKTRERKRREEEMKQEEEKRDQEKREKVLNARKKRKESAEGEENKHVKEKRLSRKRFSQGVIIIDSQGNEIEDDVMFSTKPDVSKQPPHKKKKVIRKTKDSTEEQKKKYSTMYSYMQETPAHTLPMVIERLRQIPRVEMTQQSVKSGMFEQDIINSMELALEREGKEDDVKESREFMDHFLIQRNINVSKETRKKLILLYAYGHAKKIDVVEGLYTLALVPFDLDAGNEDWPVILQRNLKEKYRVGHVSFNIDDIKDTENNNWFNDNLIHAYLNGRARDINTQHNFTVKILLSHTAWMWEEKRYTWLFETVPLSRYKLIILPICTGKHWSVMVADVQNKTVHMYDSMETVKKRKRSKEFFQRFMIFLRARWSVTQELRVEGWKLSEAMSNQQSDGSSCGVFVVMNAMAAMHDIPVGVMRQVHVPYVRRHIAAAVCEEMLLEADKLWCDRVVPVPCSGTVRQRYTFAICNHCDRMIHTQCKPPTQKTRHTYYMCDSCRKP